MNIDYYFMSLLDEYCIEDTHCSGCPFAVICFWHDRRIWA